jgi:hypothetical protein
MNFIQKSFKTAYYFSKASDERLLTFSTDHREKLSSNNPAGKYDAILAALNAAMSAFTSSYLQEDTDVNLRQERTAALDLAEGNALKFIRDSFSLIRYTFRNNTPVIQEFYPYGLNEYNAATRQEWVLLLPRFHDAAVAHQTELPETFATDVNAVLVAYRTAYEAQVGQKGEVSGSRLASDESRTELEKQLMRNLYTIACENIGNPDIAAVYFDASIVLPAQRAAGENIITGRIESLATEVVTRCIFSTDTHVLLSNRGASVLYFYTLPAVGSELPAKRVELMPKTEAYVLAGELGGEGMLYLMIHNPDQGNSGSYRCEIIDEE